MSVNRSSRIRPGDVKRAGLEEGEPLRPKTETQGVGCWEVT